MRRSLRERAVTASSAAGGALNLALLRCVFAGSRVGTRFEAEWSSPEGVWYRTMGNELIELDDKGLMYAAAATLFWPVLHTLAAQSARTL